MAVRNRAQQRWVWSWVAVMGVSAACGGRATPSGVASTPVAAPAAPATPAVAPEIALSEQTEECILCHEAVTPGIVSDWRNSLHATTTPVIALAQPAANRRISVAVDKLPAALREVAVGCYECHLEPDVPAWNVYAESKHGNLFQSLGDRWNWTAVPWKVGVDFTAPTCATCHVSELADADGEVLIERTHDFGARLWVRLFGLPYAVAQPRSGDTSTIRNKDGQPLPVTFSGEPASDYLIDADEQKRRRALMTRVCVTCHSTDWTERHFEKLDATIAETNAMTLTATKLMQRAWKLGLADATNPFDEPLERKWVKQWLFYANSIRYASAMAGPDYAAFKNGWWYLTETLQEMKKQVDQASPAKKKKKRRRK